MRTITRTQAGRVNCPSRRHWRNKDTKTTFRQHEIFSASNEILCLIPIFIYKYKYIRYLLDIYLLNKNVLSIFERQVQLTCLIIPCIGSSSYQNGTFRMCFTNKMVIRYRIQHVDTSINAFPSHFDYIRMTILSAEQVQHTCIHNFESR